MDYEDFVEGIKPRTENGHVSYDYEDGIFKKMVVFSKYAFVDNQKKSIVAFKNFNERWNFLIDSINENKSYEFVTKNNTKMTVLEVTDNSIKLQGESAVNATTCYKNELEKLWNVFGESNLEEIKNFNVEFRKHVGGNETAKYAILKALQNVVIDSYYIQEDDQLDYDKKKELVSKLNDEDFKIVPNKNFVLIIDEINRGNVSKIFGELITLLEADKRLGGDHPIKVTLPYSKESFGVPSNLYIIGTMNTTDRSVGNIDYAVRRRFAFVTLESKKEVIEEHYKNDEILKNKALALFEAIESFLKKHKFEMDFADLMVGHSYFLAKNEEDLELKWRYEIVPLLHEYYKDGIIKQDVKTDTTIEDFCISK
ncbi:MAG: AAA family ATPase [Bacteroidales bacterium]|nr:AAA family ATPase [Bacteroidales bacterium]